MREMRSALVVNQSDLSTVEDDPHLWDQLEMYKTNYCNSQDYLSIVKQYSSLNLSDLCLSKPVKIKSEAGIRMKNVARGWVEDRGLEKIEFAPRRGPSFRSKCHNEVVRALFQLGTITPYIFQRAKFTVRNTTGKTISASFGANCDNWTCNCENRKLLFIKICING